MEEVPIHLVECIAKDSDSAFAIASRFFRIIGDMKGSYTLFDEFVKQAGKLHSSLRSTLGIVDQFLESLQKIADIASAAKGSTRDIGAGLTRLCFRHRAIESRIKLLTSVLLENLITPASEKIELWKKRVSALDQKHSKEYKRKRADIKKRSADAIRMYNKARKQKNHDQIHTINGQITDIQLTYQRFKSSECSMLQSAMLEQRSHFCHLATCLKPVVSEEVSLSEELGHLVEAMSQLEKHTADLYTPAVSPDQLLDDPLCVDGDVSDPALVGSTVQRDDAARRASVCSSIASSVASGGPCSLAVGSDSSARAADQTSADVSTDSRGPSSAVEECCNGASALSLSSADCNNMDPVLVDHHSACGLLDAPVLGNSVQRQLEQPCGGGRGLALLAETVTPAQSSCVRGVALLAETAPQIQSSSGSGVSETDSGLLQRLKAVGSTDRRHRAISGVTGSGDTSRPHTISSEFSRGGSLQRPPLTALSFLAPRRRSTADKSSGADRFSSHYKRPGVTRPEHTAHTAHCQPAPAKLPDFHHVVADMVVPHPIYANAEQLQLDQSFKSAVTDMSASSCVTDMSSQVTDISTDSKRNPGAPASSSVSSGSAQFQRCESEGSASSSGYGSVQISTNNNTAAAVNNSVVDKLPGLPDFLFNIVSDDMRDVRPVSINASEWCQLRRGSSQRGPPPPPPPRVPSNVSPVLLRRDPHFIQSLSRQLHRRASASPPTPNTRP